ncbi:MAG: hypothetical protein FJ271_04900 [Planctomycetes bacterium]|nr:hypothetical protein [Planctomycetota bacterium]
MDCFDLLWQIGQDRELSDLRGQLEKIRHEHDRTTRGRDGRDLEGELLEMKLRHGLLVRLLIAKGVITAAEYAALIAETRMDT